MSHYLFEIIFLILSAIMFLPKSKIVYLGTSYTSKQENETPTAKIFLLVMSVFLGSLVALRSELIGNDTIQYVRSFSAHRIWDFDDRFEPGYIVLQTLTKYISENEYSILVTGGIITTVLFYCFIKKNSKFYFLSIVLFVFLGFWGQSMNILRQSIACAIVTYSYRYILSKSLLKFIVTVLVAYTFHSTAIIFLLAWIIKDVKVNIRNVVITLLIIGFIYMAFSSLLGLAFSINDSYEGYVDSIFGEGNRIGALFQAFCYIGLVLLVFLIRIRVGSSLFRQYGLDRLLLLCIIGASIVFISYNMSIFGRIAQYFNVFQLILVPNAVRLLKPKSQYWISLLIFIYVNLFFWLIQLLRPDWNRIFPYQTFL